MRYITTAERIGMKKGIEKGIEKGVKNTAKNMLKIGLDIGLISRVTGLSEAEIRKLPKERDAEQEHVFAG
jgi:predicted transposase/invertase (TIGR01784 family)